MASSSSEKKRPQKTGKKGDAKGNPIPFEPNSLKSAKKSTTAPAVPRESKKSRRKNNTSSRQSTIPEVVSQRMAKRMAFFCGVPTLLGIAVLPSSYLLISRDIVALPNTAVLLVSLLCLGLSVLGLTYGVVSASWDEDQPGSLLGIQEFKINWQRFRQSWKDRSSP